MIGETIDQEQHDTEGTRPNNIIKQLDTILQFTSNSRKGNRNQR